MAIEKRRRNAAAPGGNVRTGRRLHLERLEPRSVLSAAVFFPAPSAAAVVHAMSPAPPAIEVGPFSAAAQSAEFARTSLALGRNAAAIDLALQQGFARPFGVQSVEPAPAPAPDNLGAAATQVAAAAAPAGQGLVSLGGMQSSRYETIVLTVVWENEFSDVQNFVALPANDAINPAVLPSPRMETNLGMAAPATILAPLPTNSSNGVGVANSTAAAVAPFQVAIAPPYATTVAVAAASAPAAELSGATDPLGGETTRTSSSDSDSAEGGLLALDDMPAAAMQLDRQPGALLGASFASNLNAPESAGSALVGSTAARGAWAAINATARDGAFAEWQARAAAAAGFGAASSPSAAGIDEGGGIELAAACPAAIASNDSAAAPLDAAATPLRLEPIRFDSAMGMFDDVEVAVGGAPSSAGAPHVTAAGLKKGHWSAAVTQVGAGDAPKAEAASLAGRAPHQGLANLAEAWPALLSFTAVVLFGRVRLEPTAPECERRSLRGEKLSY